MTKEEIIRASKDCFTQLSNTCMTIDDNAFFERPENKWSVAENLQHLVLSTRTTTLAYRLPKFLVKWIGGNANRISQSHDELLAKYTRRLDEGATARNRYVPKPIEIKYGKDKLLTNWNRATEGFLASLKKNRSEADLDNYLVKHPLLGRITLRELCYFTIFHTRHHLQSIQNRINR